MGLFDYINEQLPPPKEQPKPKPELRTNGTKVLPFVRPSEKK